MTRSKHRWALIAVQSCLLLTQRGLAETRPAEAITLASELLIVRTPLRLQTDDGPPTLALSGDAVAGQLGDPRAEYSGRGVRLLSAARQSAGAMTFSVGGVGQEAGRWYRVRVRGLAQEHFCVSEDALFIRVEFFAEGGKNPLDHVTKSIYGQVERERDQLADENRNRNLDAAAWRDYAIEFRTPFAEVDTLRVSVGFEHGNGTDDDSEFWIREVEVSRIPDPADYIAPADRSRPQDPPALARLVKLGGRWYYDPQGGDEHPRQFDHTNADRLYYLTDRLETPFAGNMTSWLRTGYLDRGGELVVKDEFVEDNVVVSFTETHLVMKSKNLPNHPTAIFPDRWRLLDGNPNYIQEQQATWYIPLEPKENPDHLAMDAGNRNGALPRGAIGVAVNGVTFFNPFDEGYTEAIWRLDRCCGHPSPRQAYHYHKYPACVNTPWCDDGRDHSPLIGFAFDGFPVYGPYESAGELAKDSKKNPLNEFNLHADDARGPHYHVTPGKFPHIVGGYWGEYEPKNRPRRPPPR